MIAPLVYVIAQQYSSTIFGSLRFLCRKETFGLELNNANVSFCYLFKIA
jgi:hypothetical protein